ncbi:hypothetical protein [Ectobacillus ponti]|uniref:Uncharacterized protein n=1 Tax=Ectobacillus ponti TaxID=2961894 RepID=A0AA41XAF9_9BACI|nr:hypothetical protein [Ectobacillus ponti]MCP8968431.1 hypothetical protein [Ectobacillus ponti]
MKKKLGLALCVAGVLMSAMVFAEGSTAQGVATSQQSQKGPVKVSQDQTLVITIEEQDAVEHSAVQEGVVTRQDGSKFLFFKGNSTLAQLGLLPVR